MTTLAALAKKAAEITGEFDPDGKAPGLFFVRRIAPTEIEAFVYDPVICLILQGRKETVVGDRSVAVGPGDCIVVSHDLPVVARISEASPEVPYLALVARLELAEVRSLHEEVEPHAEEASDAYAVGRADDALLDVMARYVELVSDPAGVDVLAPLIRREMHFRLLRSPQGAMLRRLVRRDSHASNISRAIERLRSDFKDGLEVPALARAVGMSTSSFHKHFKQVTSTTPLQYQKNLRLTEARKLLQHGLHSVSSAAFEVGYESPTQFSREYARKFGVPPSAHRGEMRASA